MKNIDNRRCARDYEQLKIRAIKKGKREMDRLIFKSLLRQFCISCILDWRTNFIRKSHKESTQNDKIFNLIKFSYRLSSYRCYLRAYEIRSWQEQIFTSWRVTLFFVGTPSRISSLPNSLKVQMAIIGHTTRDSIPAKFRYKERRGRVRAGG